MYYTNIASLSMFLISSRYHYTHGQYNPGRIYFSFSIFLFLSYLKNKYFGGLLLLFQHVVKVFSCLHCTGISNILYSAFLYINFTYTKCYLYQMLTIPNVIYAKCYVDEILPLPNVTYTKC